MTEKYRIYKYEGKDNAVVVKRDGNIVSVSNRYGPTDKVFDNIDDAYIWIRENEVKYVVVKVQEKKIE